MAARPLPTRGPSAASSRRRTPMSATAWAGVSTREPSASLSSRRSKGPTSDTHERSRASPTTRLSAVSAAAPPTASPSSRGREGSRAGARRKSWHNDVRCAPIRFPDVQGPSFSLSKRIISHYVFALWSKCFWLFDVPGRPPSFSFHPPCTLRAVVRSLSLLSAQIAFRHLFF